jgi:flagellin
MLNINTNYAASYAANAAKQTSRGLDSAMEKLASGSRINYAKDDAAGQAISTRLTAEIQGLAMASRNASDGQSLLDTADGALAETHNLLLRMRELAVQSANGTMAASDRTALDAEVGQLVNEVERIAQNTTWAGNNLVNASNSAKAVAAGGMVAATDVVTSTAHGFSNGDVVAATLAANETMTGLIAGKHYVVTDVTANTFKLATVDANGAATAVDFATNDNSAAASFRKVEKAYTFQVGTANSTESQITIGINDARAIALGLVTDGDADGDFDAGEVRVAIESQANAQTAIGKIDTAIGNVSTARAELGAYSNRLSNTMANLDQVAVNLSSSKGRIQDADFATETSNLAKNQILQQAATAMLAQANASKNSVLTLVS